MRSGHRLHAITHCHSIQSSNQASPMDAYIRAAVERVTRESADDFDWSESLTTPADIAALLAGNGGGSQTDLIFVTDHVNETFERFDSDLVDLAIGEARLAIGAEIQTVAEEPPGSGQYRAAPEVLVYGGPDRVRARGGWHYGINGDFVRALQEGCRPPSHPRVELHRVLDYCRENGVAHVLAHPLDGHFCGVETTLAALSACRFVEAVNGGFSGGSTRRLRRYIRLHNALAGGVDERSSGLAPRSLAAHPGATGGKASLAHRLVLHLGGGAEASDFGYAAPGMIGWGGSDAHLGNYDRVRMLYRPPAGAGNPGVPELLTDMLALPTQALLRDEVFIIEGRSNHMASCLAEVLRLVATNARRNRETFRGVRRMTRLAVLGPWLAVRKVVRHRLHQERLGRELDRVLTEAERLAGRR